MQKIIIKYKNQKKKLLRIAHSEIIKLNFIKKFIKNH